MTYIFPVLEGAYTAYNFIQLGDAALSPTYPQVYFLSQKVNNIIKQVLDHAAGIFNFGVFLTLTPLFPILNTDNIYVFENISVCLIGIYILSYVASFFIAKGCNMITRGENNLKEIFSKAVAPEIAQGTDIQRAKPQKHISRQATLILRIALTGLTIIIGGFSYLFLINLAIQVSTLFFMVLKHSYVKYSLRFNYRNNQAEAPFNNPLETTVSGYTVSSFSFLLPDKTPSTKDPCPICHENPKSSPRYYFCTIKTHSLHLECLIGNLYSKISTILQNFKQTLTITRERRFEKNREYTITISQTNLISCPMCRQIPPQPIEIIVHQETPYKANFTATVKIDK